MYSPHYPLSGRLIPRLPLLLCLLVACQVSAWAQFPGNAGRRDNPEELLTRADRLYDYGRDAKNPYDARQALRSAVPIYENFLRAVPGHQLADKVWYRLGMSYLLTGQILRAEDIFDGVIKTYQKGHYVATSAYRLGAQRWNDSRWEEAAGYFGLTARQAAKQSLKHEALYYQARCYILAKNPNAATAVLDAILGDPLNPFHGFARLARGQALAATGRHEDALREFEPLLGPGNDLRDRAEALLAAALSASKLGDRERADRYLGQVLELPGLDASYKAKAQLTLMQNRFDEEDWTDVVRLFQKGEFPGDAEAQGEVFMLGGMALAKLGRHHEAIRLFFNVERLSPRTKRGFEASYRRLASFYEVNGANIPSQADALVEIYANRFPGHEWIQRARLMKAEALFHQGRIAEAAAAYDDLKTYNLSRDLLGGLYFKRGWALAESGDYNRAAQEFTRFISGYPEDPRMNQALAMRGSAYFDLGDRPSALRDFDKLLTRSPEEDLVAFAQQRRACIFREERSYNAMLEAYSTLLEQAEDLTEDTIANANYWIGWGWFKLNEWEKCLAPFRKARTLVPEFYKEPAGTHLVVAAYSLKDAAELKKAVNQLRHDMPDRTLPPKMLTWLGLQLFQNGDFDGADDFLTMASTPDEPLNTDLVVWRHLAKARIELRHYDRAMGILPIVLEREERKFWRADAYLDKAHTHIGLGDWDKAREACHAGLQLDPDGTVRAGLQMSLGTIAMQRGDFESAAASFLRTADLFIDDREIKPLALHRAAEALDALGRSAQAAEIRTRISREFVAWEPPKR